jgi:hypothetical protein
MLECRVFEASVAAESAARRSGRRTEEELIRLYGHPLTQLIVVVIAGAAVSALFGLLRALRRPVGYLAYGSLVVTLYAYWRIGDKYFSQGIWEISVACLAVMAFTLKQVPLLRTVLAIAIVEFGSRINETAYPRQALVALGIAGAMILIATFWGDDAPVTRTAPRPRTAPKPRSAPKYRPGPQVFDPFTGKPPRTQRTRRSAWPAIAAMWDRARTTRTRR